MWAANNDLVPRVQYGSRGLGECVNFTCLQEPYEGGTAIKSVSQMEKLRVCQCVIFTCVYHKLCATIATSLSLNRTVIHPGLFGKVSYTPIDPA